MSFDATIGPTHNESDYQHAYYSRTHSPDHEETHLQAHINAVICTNQIAYLCTVKGTIVYPIIRPFRQAHVCPNNSTVSVSSIIIDNETAELPLQQFDAEQQCQ